MGNLDYDGNLVRPNVGTVNPPLPLRNNIRIRCGDRGSREDLCWLRGGDLHMDGTKALGIKDETLENVQIEGFVFMGGEFHHSFRSYSAAEQQDNAQRLAGFEI